MLLSQKKDVRNFVPAPDGHLFQVVHGKIESVNAEARRLDPIADVPRERYEGLTVPELVRELDCAYRRRDAAREFADRGLFAGVK